METFYNVLLAFMDEPAFTAGFFVYGYVVALFAKRLIQTDRVPSPLKPVTRGEYIVVVVLVAHMLHVMLMAAALVFTAGFFLFVLAGFMVFAPVFVFSHALAAFPIPYQYQGMRVRGDLVIFLFALIGFVLWQVSFSAPAAVGTKEDRQEVAMDQAIREGNIHFAQTIQNVEDRNEFYRKYSYRNNQPEACGYIGDKDSRFNCYDNDPEFRKAQYLCQDYPGLSESDQYYLKSVCRFESGLFQTYHNQPLREGRFSCSEYLLWFQQSWYQQYRKSPDIGEDQNILCQNLEKVYSLTQSGNVAYCDKFSDGHWDYQRLCLGLFAGSKTWSDACLEVEYDVDRIRLQCDEDQSLEDLIFYRNEIAEFIIKDFTY